MEGEAVIGTLDRARTKQKRGNYEGYAIAVQGLVKRYGDFTAVNGVSLSVRPDEIFGILGPNGAGKTTTLEMIEGLRPPDAGTIQVAGIDAIKDPKSVKKLIGVQLQSTALFDFLTTYELVELFAALYNTDTSKEKINRLIDSVSLQEKIGSKVNELSGGQQQRLSIALALANEPEIVFLDEPTTGLDPQARRNLWDVIKMIRDSGVTVVLTTHYMEEAEILCDRVAVMDHGQIIACDTPRNLIDSLDAPTTIHARIGDAAVTVSELRAMPSVTEASLDDGLLELRSDSVQATMGALLALSSERGFKLDNLSTAGATLEDVFLGYTGRSLRE